MLENKSIWKLFLSENSFPVFFVAVLVEKLIDYFL